MAEDKVSGGFSTPRNVGKFALFILSFIYKFVLFERIQIYILTIGEEVRGVKMVGTRVSEVFFISETTKLFPGTLINLLPSFYRLFTNLFRSERIQICI